MSELPFNDISSGDPDSIAHFLSVLWHINSRNGDHVFLSVRNKRGNWRDIPLKSDRHLWALVSKSLPDCDLFFCPNPFSAPEIHRENARPTSFAWCDIDRGDLNKFEIAPSIYWQTSAGSHQGIWVWDRFEDPDRAEAFSHALAQNGDRGGWSITKRMRSPGSLNFKYDYAPRVKLLRFDLTPIERRPKIVLHDWARTQGNEGIVNRQQALTLDGRRLSVKYRVALQLKAPAHRQEEGGRSQTIFWQACLMRKAGATNEEIAAMLWQCSRVFQSRFGRNERDGWKEIERLCSKLRSNLH